MNPDGCCHHSHGPHSHDEVPRGTPDLTERLRRGARRVTGARQAILKVLEHHPHPLSRKEIFETLRPGRCDLATVYRSLQMLEDLGLVRRYDFGDGVARFEVSRDGPSGHHHHLVCTRCSTIVELPECLAREWETRIAEQSGFENVTHRLEFFGTCPACQQVNAPPKTPAPAPSGPPTERRGHTNKATPKRGLS